MRRLEMFFDYSCPFCKRGHGHLLAALAGVDDVELVWKPCEAHPRPEPGRHSDVLIQTLYHALARGEDDVWALHERLYALALDSGRDIEDVDTVVEVAALKDGDALRASLAAGTYAQAVLEGNDYAYEQSGVWAVPSFRMDGRKLDAREGVGVTAEELAAFLRGEG